MTPAKLKKAIFDSMEYKINGILNQTSKVEEKLQEISALLKENVPHYHWVGFYLVDKESPKELILGSFEGDPTDHVRISFGRGICGQAAERKETFIVQDVSKETNYLSCSPHVKSEIVVPIMKDDEIVGELDIDSHDISPFTEEDESFLKKICDWISALF
jgi:GAF domain-containing protein